MNKCKKNRCIFNYRGKCHFCDNFRVVEKRENDYHIKTILKRKYILEDK